MAEVLVDLEVINKFLLPDLGLVDLIPGLTTGNTEPSLLPATPSVMGSFELVASNSYRWEYNQVRYLKLGYVLERDGEYESGEIDLISKAVRVRSLDPATYVIPTLSFLRTMTQQTSGSLNVDLTMMTDSLSVSSVPKFGLAYKITNASPAVFPSLRVFVIKLLPLED